MLWHRVRGKLQIFAVVDSHVMIHGPLHGNTILNVDTQGEWRWIGQDLRRDVGWERDHIVHVEYAASAGAAAAADMLMGGAGARGLGGCDAVGVFGVGVTFALA